MLRQLTKKILIEVSYSVATEWVGTALWASLLGHRAVRGLVLYQVPTIWETREARGETLREKAEEYRTMNADLADVYHGASYANIPCRDDLRALKMPVLIANSRDDVVHPASSAEALAEIWPHAEVVIVDKKAELPAAFAVAFAKWLGQQPWNKGE